MTKTKEEIEIEDDELVIDDEIDEGDEKTPEELKAENLKFKSIAKRRGDKIKTLLAAQAPAPTTTVVEPETKPAPALTISQEELDLRLSGHTKEQADFIMRNGGRKALEDPFVKAALSSMKEQEEAEAAASAIPDTSGMTEVERKYTPEQLKDMSRADLEKILPKA
jgi:hypothetical protein